MQNEIDPFQLEVIKNCFDAIADDMALTLMRTSHSGIVRDSLDFSTAICDAEGRTLAQGICTPMHMGSFYDAMRNLISQYEGRIDPRDVFIFNDPFAAAGQHLPDIYISMPIFYKDRLCAWSTTVAHHSDVGASSPARTRWGRRRSSRRACACRWSSSPNGAFPTRRSGTSSRSTCARPRRC